VTPICLWDLSATSNKLAAFPGDLPVSTLLAC